MRSVRGVAQAAEYAIPPLLGRRTLKRRAACLPRTVAKGRACNGFRASSSAPAFGNRATGCGRIWYRPIRVGPLLARVFVSSWRFAATELAAPGFHGEALSLVNSSTGRRDRQTQGARPGAAYGKSRWPIFRAAGSPTLWTEASVRPFPTSHGFCADHSTNARGRWASRARNGRSSRSCCATKASSRAGWQSCSKSSRSRWRE